MTVRLLSQFVDISQDATLEARTWLTAGPDVEH